MWLISKYLGYYHTAAGKSIASNFGWLMILQIVNYALPLVTLPYLAHVIGVEGFGKLSFAAAVIVWFQTISDWGFNFTATRDVAKYRENRSRISEIFSNVLFARIGISLIGFIILLLLILVIPVFNENALILIISYLLVELN